MASISYDEIYSRVLDKITDYDFLEYSDSEIYESLNRKMKSVVSKPYLRRLFYSLSLDDEVHTFTYELNYTVDDDADKDFVCEAVALGIVAAWLEPKVKTTNLIHQQFTSSKESKWYNQKDHLAEVRSLLKACKYEQQCIIRDRGWINNTYLDG